MIDTADVYSAWVDRHKGGESETVLGEWLESRGVRKDMRIHTKTGMLGGKELYEPERVLKSLDASLERLRTDYIDLYYAHRDYEELSPDAIVTAFDGAAKSGKVTSLAASNFSSDRLKAMLDTAATKGAAPFSVLQNEYNLVSRDGFGRDLQDLCKSKSIPMLPYFGLAAGFLTGKYRKPEDFEEGARGAGVKKFHEKGASVLKVMDAIAEETGASHAAIALAWLREQPAIGAPIASARKPEQLTDLIASTKLDLSDAQIRSLTEAL